MNTKTITERENIVAIANAVRSKTGKTEEFTLGEIATEIYEIETGTELPELTNEGSAADLLAGKQLIDSDGNVIEGTMPDHGDLGGSITIDTENYYYDIPAGYHNGDGSVNMRLEEKTVTPTDTQQIITPSAGKVLSKVTVEAASSGGSGGFYNGTKWTRSNITSDYFHSIHNANGVWVAGGTGLYYSTDGKTWTRSNITSGSFYSIHNANGVWVAGSVGLYYSVSWEAGT